MGLGVLKRSIVKALKQTGITVATAAGIAGATVLTSPEIMAPIWAATGPVALVILPVASIGGQAIIDYLKHRSK